MDYEERIAGLEAQVTKLRKAVTLLQVVIIVAWICIINTTLYAWIH